MTWRVHLPLSFPIAFYVWIKTLCLPSRHRTRSSRHCSGNVTFQSIVRLSVHYLPCVWRSDPIVRVPHQTEGRVSLTRTPPYHRIPSTSLPPLFIILRSLNAVKSLCHLTCLFQITANKTIHKQCTSSLALFFVTKEKFNRLGSLYSMNEILFSLSK